MTYERRRNPSQRDVAALAGVSRTTVSLVTNGIESASISADTRERVWAAVRELGFRPNEIARTLRRRSSGLIGMLTRDTATTPFAVAIIRGAQRAAVRHRKTLLVMDTEGPSGVVEDALSRLAGWQVEGIIFAADAHRAVDAPAGLPDVPVVLVDCFAADDGLPSIVPDERQGGRAATEVLLEAGHRRIGMINGPEGWPASEGRLLGYLDAHRSAGVPVDRRLVRVGDWWQESGVEQAGRLLDGRRPPTALFCANDWMAMGAYDAVRERGLRIPHDVAVVGFDDREEIAAHMRPRLTTVALPYLAMGERGVEFLLAAGATGHPGPHRSVLPCSLVLRDSVRELGNDGGAPRLATADIPPPNVW